MKNIKKFLSSYLLFSISLLIFLTSGNNVIASMAVNNVDKHGIALHGYDPVSYHYGGPLKGKDELNTSHDGIRYLFVSQENMERFSSKPEKYIPAYGGWCAWAMIEGEKVDVDPKTYKIVNDVTYLFYNSFFINTLKKWNKLSDQETEARLIEKADKNYTIIKSR